MYFFIAYSVVCIPTTGHRQPAIGTRMGSIIAVQKLYDKFV